MGLFWNDATAKVLRQEQAVRNLARSQMQAQLSDISGILFNAQMPNGGIGVANPSGTFADLAAAEAWALSIFNELATRGAIN